MASNILPSGIHDLMWLATQMAAGYETHGPWLNLGFEELFPSRLADVRASESAFAVARARKAEAGRHGAAADEALTGWLAKARLALMLALGSEWSERWIEAGFTHRGTNVPKRLGARIELARGVAEFFEAHPEFSVPFADVTAAAGRAVYEAITSAAQEMREAARVAGERKRARDFCEAQLRRLMRCTVRMLACKLDRGDPRWLAFGLNQPDPAAPPRAKHWAGVDDAGKVHVATFASADHEDAAAEPGAAA